MFDFTTTTFVHDADMIEAFPGSATGQTSKALRIENKIFKYEDIVAIYRNPYVAPANAKLKVDVEGFMTSIASTSEYSDGKRFKLDFYLKRSGDNNSFYSNDFVFKGKDFHYEWTKKQNTAAKVAKMINKIIKLYGDVYLKVYTEEDTELDREVLVFENDNYGIFTEAELKVYLADASDCCTFREGGWSTVDALPSELHYCNTENTCTTPRVPYKTSEDNEDYYQEAVPAGGSTPATPQLGGWLVSYYGVNGFGTYEQLLKDLRLPTMENFRWMSPTASEMPIPGNKYVQYTIHQISCRGVLGGSAVGEVTHSKTTHVFFVPTCGCGDSGDLDAVMQTAIVNAGMGNLLLSTDTSTVGANQTATLMAGPALTSDPVSDPSQVENFTHDLSIKADVVNEEAPAAEPSNP